MPHVDALFPGVHEREDAVVRRHEVIAVAGCDDGASSCAHTWVDYDKMNRPGGEVGVRLRDRQRSVEHVECLYRMADIDNRGLGHDVEDYTLHSAHKMIVCSKVGG